jgi:hypothetical protein
LAVETYPCTYRKTRFSPILFVLTNAFLVRGHLVLVAKIQKIIASSFSKAVGMNQRISRKSSSLVID